MLQRSKEWFEARRGRFTASDIHNLLGKQGLGETGKSYAFKKAVESVYGLEEQSFVSYDMQRGIELEPFAFRKFAELKYRDFIDVQETTFFPLGEHAGASPDGLVLPKDCLEIKCPSKDKLLQIMAFGWEKVDPKYISQMQMQMKCSNSEKCYFFNYGIFDGKEMWHEMLLNRDENTIGLIEKRLPEAIELKLQYIELLTKNQQF